MKLNKPLTTLFTLISFITLWGISIHGLADNDPIITQIYSKKIPYKNISEKIDGISEYFLDKPYKLFPLGEGNEGQFDQQPIYRTDAFDCVTFVETVLALANADNPSEFKEHIKHLRYKTGIPKFTDRNHFTSIDWNYNNMRKGYFYDITYQFTDKSGIPIAEIAETIIDKPNWYKHLTKNRIKINKKMSKWKTKKLLRQLKRQAKTMQQEKSALLYLPLNKLFNKRGKPNQYIFDQIPSGAIIEIVRPDWQLKDKIGTNLNVSHLGFAIRKKGELLYREASSELGKVTDIPLTKYLKAYLDSPTVKGINVQMPLERVVNSTLTALSR